MMMAYVFSEAWARLNASPSSLACSTVSASAPRERACDSKSTPTRFRGCWGVRKEVVEALLSDVVLQLVDDGKSAVVQNKDDHFLFGQDRRIDIRVH